MVAPCKVSEGEAIEVIIKYMDHFRCGQYPRWSSDVWKRMSQDLEEKWSAACVYTNVREDRRSIMTKASKKMNLPVPKPTDQNNNITLSEESSSSFAESESDDYVPDPKDHEEGIEKFTLIITEEEWIAMKPENVQSNVDSPHETTNVKLRPGVWTNIVAKAFWLQYRMPCAFIFKRATVRLSLLEDSYIIEIRGVCKSRSCNNPFNGYGEKFCNENGLIIQVRTRDTQYSQHEIVKRPLNGLRRDEVKKELKSEGCSTWRKRQARENIRPGETEPFHLPHKDVIRQAKKEAVDAQYGVKKDDGHDLIRTIETFSENPEYGGLIHDVGSLPFYVFYSSQAQLHAYKEYKRIHKTTSTIKIDATGSLVHRIQRKNRQRSAHIFLYAIVINFEKTTICVEQMLSEQQNAPFIEFWLRKWLLRGAPRPNEAVCDYSRALLSALSMAFNNQTIKVYIAMRFQAISDARSNTRKPATYIRVDVAHLMHIVSRWPCFHKRALREIKEFYQFCVGLLVDCKTLSEFEYVLSLTCGVALQKFNDSIIDLKGANTTKEAREKLENLIANRSMNYKVQKAYLHSSQATNEQKTERKSTKEMVTQSKLANRFELNDESDTETLGETGSPLNIWIDNLVVRAKQTVCEGKDLNAFHQTMFVDHLIKLCKEFPLWSSVGLSYNAFHATSSHVEGYFNDLKTRVFAGSLPVRVDKFIKRHADDIKGSTLLFTSNLIAFRNVQNIEGEQKVTAGHTGIAENKFMNVAEDETDRNEFICLGQSKVSHGNGKCKTESVNRVLYDLDFPHDISCYVDVTEHMDAHDDSDLKSVENWRGKASEGPYIDHHSVDADKIFNAWVVQDDLSPVLEEGKNDNDADLIGAQRNDHSYCKMEASEDVDAPDITLDHTYTSFALGGQKHRTSTPNEGKHKNIRKRTTTAEKDDNPDPPKKGKYLKSYPEIRQRNQLLGLSKKPALLLNGLLCPPVKIDGKSYFLQNTCSFDAIVHILMIAGIENVHYGDFLASSGNTTLRFVHQVIEMGIKRITLENRARILKSFSKTDVYIATEERVVSYKLDATINVVNMLQHLLSSAPSITNTKVCPRCARSTNSSISIAPNHRDIARQGFEVLEEALDFHATTFAVRCQNECSGKCSLTKKTNEHIFIELDIRRDVHHTRGLNCRLDQLPVELKLEQLQGNAGSYYRLAGVVAFVPGHYTAYCRRSTGHWELFDDMNSRRRIIACKSNTAIEPHLAVYIRSLDK